MLLILREEIICAIILIFLIFYYAINKVKDKEMLFLKIAGVGLMHVIFDIATVITVNSINVVPGPINNILHVAFYLSGILFIQQFYNYVLYLCAVNKHYRKFKTTGYFPLIIFLILLIFLPMEYVEGNGTYYSYGPLAFIGYALFVIYCSICMIMLIACHKQLEKRIRRALIPMIIAMFISVILQALIPELLMTGAGITFVCIGMFVALDNPDKDYREQALWDFITGLKNRNCYNRDMDKYTHKLKSSRKKAGVIIADMNFLKAVNDKYGHAEGDKLIAAAAGVLKDNLKTADNIYRLGGDEFAAIYISPDDNTVAAEIEQVTASCSKNTDFEVPLSMAIGYASGSVDENIGDIFEKADKLMYENKLAVKKEYPSLSAR